MRYSVSQTRRQKDPEIFRLRTGETGFKSSRYLCISSNLVNTFIFRICQSATVSFLEMRRNCRRDSRERYLRSQLLSRVREYTGTFVLDGARLDPLNKRTYLPLEEDRTLERSEHGHCRRFGGCFTRRSCGPRQYLHPDIFCAAPCISARFASISTLQSGAWSYLVTDELHRQLRLRLVRRPGRLAGNRSRATKLTRLASL